MYERDPEHREHEEELEEEDYIWGNKVSVIFKMLKLPLWNHGWNHRAEQLILLFTLPEIFCIIPPLTQLQPHHAKKHHIKNQTVDFYYIPNYKEYGLPEKVKTASLAKVLEYIAQYKQLSYCPFGEPTQCYHGKYSSIVSRIIADVMANETANSTDLSHNGTEELEIDAQYKAKAPIIHQAVLRQVPFSDPNREPIFVLVGLTQEDIDEINRSNDDNLLHKNFLLTTYDLLMKIISDFVEQITFKKEAALRKKSNKDTDDQYKIMKHTYDIVLKQVAKFNKLVAEIEKNSKAGKNLKNTQPKNKKI